MRPYRRLNIFKLSIVYRFLLKFANFFLCYMALFFISQRKGNSRPERIVAIVLSWKRIMNIPRVVAGLKRQSYIDDIIIFHNHPSWLWIPGCRNIFSDNNQGSIIRHKLAAELKNYDYFVFSDDDFELGSDFAADILPAIRTCGKQSVLGFWGRNFNLENNDEPYTSGKFVVSSNEIIPVDMLLGRFHIISKEGICELSQSRLNTPALISEDDIRANLTLQLSFKKPSYVMPVRHKLIELNAPHALKNRSFHYEYRNQAVIDAVNFGWQTQISALLKKSIVK